MGKREGWGVQRHQSAKAPHVATLRAIPGEIRLLVGEAFQVQHHLDRPAIGHAWKTYWHDHSTPSPSECRHDGEALATAARQFDDLTMATAERAGGVPRLYDETGGSVPAIQQEKHAQHLDMFYGPQGKPVAGDAPRTSWLTPSP